MADEEKPATILGVFHAISTRGGNPSKCPQCGSGPDKWEVRNYDFAFHDGEIYCTVCGKFIRLYDAG